MAIEVRPVGVTCNLRCTYCYEQSMRDVQPVHRYNKAAVLAQLEHVQGQWSLFGGEALIIPLDELEELLKIGFERWKCTGIQTNGTLITPAHVELFIKYNTHVGISLDGPGELNDSRWAGTLEATRRMTERTHAAIDMMFNAAATTGNNRLIPSLIITLHKGNASADRWPQMKAWLQEMDKRGVVHVNFHFMEMDYQANEWVLPHDQLQAVMMDLWDLSATFKNIHIINFKEIVELLRGNDHQAFCVWRACDPWNTSAVQGLESDGSPSHCSRTNKDGINWLPAEGTGQTIAWQIGTFQESSRSYERQLSLYVTPQENGGCKDCRFWMMCQGNCPGTGLESVAGEAGDWRLRSIHCQMFKDMFEEGEKRLLAIGESPLSLHKDLPQYEALLYDGWKRGANYGMTYSTKCVREHITPDAMKLQTTGEYKDSHGDGHGDEHGDHYDMANPQHGDSKQ